MVDTCKVGLVPGWLSWHPRAAKILYEIRGRTWKFVSRGALEVVICKGTGIPVQGGGRGETKIGRTRVLSPRGCPFCFWEFFSLQYLSLGH